MGGFYQSIRDILDIFKTAKRKKKFKKKSIGKKGKGLPNAKRKRKGRSRSTDPMW